MQIENILLQPAQHLAGDLPADASIDEIPIREIFIEPPEVGDRVAQKHHSRILRGRGG
jgi:hypothetical protein